ncbi:Uu.00g088130.m01.CDS01 [Anthostomella pinea]|uniref:Uu.00g088130.m01.CDS01 n=1 Tax=Anthostomella pinea TaxID=933095 RepID=A0AAI8VN38_9PEZI|nr:Uu.00g088130.m01.CDS01 [Anthostomella pinea]
MPQQHAFEALLLENTSERDKQAHHTPFTTTTTNNNPNPNRQHVPTRSRPGSVHVHPSSHVYLAKFQHLNCSSDGFGPCNGFAALDLSDYFTQQPRSALVELDENTDPVRQPSLLDAIRDAAFRHFLAFHGVDQQQQQQPASMPDNFWDIYGNKSSGGGMGRPLHQSRPAPSPMRAVSHTPHTLRHHASTTSITSSTTTNTSTAAVAGIHPRNQQATTATTTTNTTRQPLTLAQVVYDNSNSKVNMVAQPQLADGELALVRNRVAIHFVTDPRLMGERPNDMSAAEKDKLKPKVYQGL